MEEKKKNNAETLEQVKKEYQKSCMTQEQVEQMKKRIEEAKAEKQKKVVNSYMGRKNSSRCSSGCRSVYRFAKYI